MHVDWNSIVVAVIFYHKKANLLLVNHQANLQPHRWSELRHYDGRTRCRGGAILEESRLPFHPITGYLLWRKA